MMIDSSQTSRSPYKTSPFSRRGAALLFTAAVSLALPTCVPKAEADDTTAAGKAGTVQESEQRVTKPDEQPPQYQTPETSAPAETGVVTTKHKPAGHGAMAAPFSHTRAAGRAAAPNPVKSTAAPAMTVKGTKGTRGFSQANYNFDADKILKESDQRLSANPDDAMAHCNRGYAYTQLNQIDKALADFNDAIRLDGSMAVAYVGRANCYYEKQKYKEGLVDCNKAISLAPTLAMAYSVRGNIYSKLEKYAQSLADHNKALALDSHGQSEADYINRSRDKYLLKDYAGAKADATIAINKNPRNAQAYDNRGLAENELKEYAAAIADYNKALSLIPNKPEYLCHRGISEAELGRLTEAIADFTHALELKPRYALACYDRGIAEMLNKEWEKATKDVQQAIEWDPHYALALYELPLDPVKGGMDKELATPEEYFYRATTRILMIKNETALADLQRYLDMTNWRGDLAMSSVILMYLGNTFNHNPQLAGNVLTAASEHCDTAAWPYPVIRYLKREISEKDLISQASGPDQLTDAHGWAGIDQMLAGNKADSIPNLEWAKEQGTGSLVSYSLAVREIEKLQFAHHRQTEMEPSWQPGQ